MAARPSISPILAIFEPIILPIAMDVLPLNAATTEIKSSGAEVPKATIVRPTTSFETPCLNANEDDPDTSQLPPIYKSEPPTRINTMVKSK